MAIVSITQGAKLVRKSRQTLYAHSKKKGASALSFTRMADGSNGVDTAELERVYGKLHMTPEEINDMKSDTVNDTSDKIRPALTVQSDSRDKALQAEIDRISQLLENEKRERKQDREDLKTQLEDIKNQRDEWQEQAKSVTRQLEHFQPKEKPKRRFFGLLPA